MRKSSLFLSFASLFLLLSFSSGRDRFGQREVLKDGETLVSPGERFVLGFFSPGGSTKRYLGIWFFVSNSTVAWVANRDNPLTDSSGVLAFDSTGSLILTGSPNRTLWSAEKRGSAVAVAVAQLLDSGNFVLREESRPETEDYLWQSFDYPTDTLLPGMKMGRDFRNRRDLNLSSWMNESDPSTGEYTYKMDGGEAAQPYLVRNASEVVFRSGPWNGLEFSGHHRMRSFSDLSFTVVHNDNESYYQYQVTQPRALARLVVDSSGYLRRFAWDKRAMEWQERWSAPDDSVCDNYDKCGPNSVCNSGSTAQCVCFEAFQPRDPEDWNNQIWRGGCERRTNLSCREGDGFLRKNRMKLPDTANATVRRGMRFDECEGVCLGDCSCVAYAPADIRDGDSGCIFWFGDLVDIRNFSDAGQDLYLRLEKGDLERIVGSSSKTKMKVIIGVTVGAVASLLLALGGYLVWRKRKQTVKTTTEGSKNNHSARFDFPDEENDLPLFGLDTISVATNNFADVNKIGRGGFGEVYKGQFQDGQLVAVKRIYSESGEGIAEFMTEVKLIAKLQHRNLVRLLGCCSGGGERLLVYEYMPNGSLDFFIFGDAEKRSLLDWDKRLEIILGIARGLLYLHQDSRLRVIHRDLKAANVLLDEAMNPKISDFGTARIIERDQLMHKTMKIVGTIGYMSPEYVVLGKFSEKSDIFSFGVLLLEIMSGRRNNLSSVKNPCMELLANAWRLCAENQSEKLLDSCLRPPEELSEIKRFIQVGLLCVQETPEIRPTMQQTVLMLVNRSSVLPTPEKPGFFHPTSLTAAADGGSDTYHSSSTLNAHTVTDFDPR